MDKAAFEVLRVRYKAAIDAYHAHAEKIAERSKDGVRPPAQELFEEEQALYHFAKVRREMLDALAALQHRRG